MREYGIRFLRQPNSHAGSFGLKRIAMVIRCWGSRGSIPVSGKQYVRYGGDTTCLEIRSKDNEIIIVDAGTGIRRLGNKLMKEGLFHYHLVFTHAHWDHVLGMPFFKPIYLPQTKFRVLKCPFPSYVGKIFSRVMGAPNFPVSFSDIKSEFIYEKACSMSFEVGSVTIEHIALSHPNTGSGYKFTEDGKSFVFLTDNELELVHPGGLPYSCYAEFCKGADLLFHDAEYMPHEYDMVRGWGHSTYTKAIEMAIEAGVKRLGMFHLNQDRTDREVDKMVKLARKMIAEQGADLECFAVGADAEFRV